MDREFDKQHIWHQYSSLTNPIPTYPVSKAKGAKVYLEDGTELIDGMSSWWNQIHGYNNDELNQAMYDQIPKFTHFMFAGVSHEPAIALSKKLIEMTPDELDNVFFADSGSVAVEVGLKLSHLYWAGKREMGQTDKPKHRFLTINYGYHGDTFGAMSVCDPVNSMHRNYSGYLTKNFFVEAPQSRFDGEFDPNDVEPLRKALEENHESIAAVIMEPIVQGASGMRIYHPEYLRQVRKLCDEFDCLMVLDEIATGFGRTGKLFACEHAGIVPDIMLCGKGLTGGYLPLAAVLMKRHVAEWVCENPSKRFFHGPTYMAHAKACAVGDKSLEILQRGEWRSQVAKIAKIFKEELFDKLQDLAIVEDLRGLGAIAVIQLVKPFETEQLQALFVKQGLWVRPFGKLIYLLPPFVIEEQDMYKLCRGTVNVVKSLKL